MSLIDRDKNGRDDRDDLRALAERALTDRGFRTHFSAEVMRAVVEHRPPDDAALRDLTGLPWSSIDNELSRDLDQVEYAERHDGFVRVMVGVAEVADYAPPRGPVDRAAEHNTATVYTAGGVFPMLPVALSEDETSLLDGLVRRAMVTSLDVAPDGSVLDARHFPAYVRNAKKLTYPEVSAWLDGDAAPSLDADPVLQEQLALQETAARWLRAERVARGGAGFDLPETELVRDADGHVVDIVTRTQTRAGRIVEDLMIAVNEAVARTLEGSGLSSIRRAVPPPPRWDRMRAVAERWGYALPEAPDACALGTFLARASREHPDDAEEITVAVMKLSGRGAYVLHEAGSDQPDGHFGLATAAYAHSTAPSRRYVDVAAQRLLHALHRGHAPPLGDDELAAIAERCTVMAANAARVERQVGKSAAALFLADRVGHRFEAVVSGVTARGTWVRLLGPAVEGKLVAKAEGLDVGEHLTVRLEVADVARGHLDFSRVEG